MNLKSQFCLYLETKGVSKKKYDTETKKIKQILNPPHCDGYLGRLEFYFLLFFGQVA